MPRTPYQDKEAEDIYFNGTPMADQNPDSFSQRAKAVERAIEQCTLDPQGKNSTDFKRKKVYARGE